jgi:general secretion pathway protein M
MAAIPLYERWGLNPREQRLATILLGFVAFLLLIAVPVALEWLAQSRASDNQDVRAALGAVQAARGQVRDRQARKESIARRYSTRAPTLAGFLEQSARAQKLEVTDSVDRPDIPHGKRYVERTTVIHLKKSGMFAIAKFLEKIEQSKLPVAVSRLNVRKRSGEPDSYDCEVGISAYDRTEQAPTPDAADKDKKP